MKEELETLCQEQNFENYGSENSEPDDHTRKSQMPRRFELSRGGYLAASRMCFRNFVTHPRGFGKRSSLDRRDNGLLIDCVDESFWWSRVGSEAPSIVIRIRVGWTPSPCRSSSLIGLVPRSLVFGRWLHSGRG